MELLDEFVHLEKEATHHFKDFMHLKKGQQIRFSTLSEKTLIIVKCQQDTYYSQVSAMILLMML